MAVAGSVVVNLDASTASFKSKIDDSTQSLDKFKQHTEGAGASIKEMFEHGLGIGSGIELMRKGFEGVGLFVEQLKQTFEEVGNIGRNALRLGFSPEDMSRFTHAANAAHVEVGALETGVFKLQRTIGDVLAGNSKEGAEALQRLGLSAKQLESEDPSQQFKDVAFAIERMTSQTEKAATVQALFGRGGAQLIPLFHDLTAALNEADQIGFTRTEADIKRVEQAERTLAAATDSVKGALMDLASSPAAQTFANNIKGIVDGTRSLLELAGVKDMPLKAQYESARDSAVALQNEQSRLMHEVVRFKEEGNPEKVVETYDELAKVSAKAETALRHAAQAAAGLGNAPDVMRPKEFEDGLRIVTLIAEKMAQAKTQFQEAHKSALTPGFSAEDLAGSELVQKQFDRQEKEVAAVFKRLREETAEFKPFSRLNTQNDPSKWLESVRERYLKDVEKLKEDGDTSLVDQEKLKILYEQIDAEEKHKKLVEEAKRISEELMSPAEKYKQRLQEINELLEAQLITQAQAGHLAQEAADKFTTAEGKGQGKDSDHRADAVIRQFSFDVPNLNQSGTTDPMKRAAQLLEQNDRREQGRDVQFRDIWKYVRDIAQSGNQQVSIPVN